MHMRNLLKSLIIIFFICPITAYAQTFKIKKAIHHIEEGDFMRSLENILEYRKKNSFSPLSFFYITSGF
jgi:hypothetical protein